MGLALNLFCKLISQSKYIATIELIEKVHFFFTWPINVDF